MNEMKTYIFREYVTNVQWKTVQIPSNTPKNQVWDSVYDAAGDSVEDYDVDHVRTEVEIVDEDDEEIERFGEGDDEED